MANGIKIAKNYKNKDGNNRDMRLSKSLSWLLRHGAQKEGLSFDDGGYIDVTKILSLTQFERFCEKDVLRVVKENDKQRFNLRNNPMTGNLQIRANQGHSLLLKEEGLLTLLDASSVPETLIHGTYFQKLKEIMKKGINRMNRNHVHFAPGLPDDTGVISGMRKSCDVYIVINAQEAAKGDLKFYRSDNNVFLCPGDEDGYVSPRYFREVWQVYPRKKIM